MSTFIEISIIISIAACVAAIMRLLKQPLIIGHIISGLLVGPYVFGLIKSPDALSTFSHLGIALLLFIVGLNLSPRVIREVAKIALVAGLGQVIFTTGLGFVIAYYLLHFSLLASLYISIALTFSSTIIVLKLLGDKDDLQKLYGKISVGFLLVQDVIAMLILLIVSYFGTNNFTTEYAIMIGLKGTLFFVCLSIISIKVLPRLGPFFAKSQELLFLFSIAWGLGIAALFYILGFTIEMGALSAGVALSMSPYHYEISAKLKSVRDFFIIIFFILLGSQIGVDNLGSIIVPALVLSAFVIIGNPIIILILMGLFGYSKKTGFFASLTVAQISEFSLILVMLGVQVGHISEYILSLITLVALITIAASSYLMMYANKIFSFFARILSIFEKKNIYKEKKQRVNYSIILFGYNRVGFDIVRGFSALKKKYIVIDFDPEVINQLRLKKINCRYGDADDDGFLNTLGLKNIKMIVSTIPDFETNMFLVEKVRDVNKKAIIITVSHSIDSARALYEQGASYVLMPHFLGGVHAAQMIENLRLSAAKYKTEKKKHEIYLNAREALGHEYPTVVKS